MQGLDVLKSPKTAEAIRTLLDGVYDNTGDPNEIEDILLFTDGRSNYSDIGTDSIKKSTMEYILKNIFWINVCLFVNEDFRNCFEDAIVIEKALLQVNDVEYTEFRDDMTLNDDENGVADPNILVNIDRYDQNIYGVIIQSIQKAAKSFDICGMTDVYEELNTGFDEQTKINVQHIIHNLVYVINAMNRNGVFRKYTKLVVDSVKDQLSN